MIEFAIFFSIVAVLIIIHICKLGQPYILIRYSLGRPTWEVWIRRFGGYNDIAGICNSEQEARDLVARIEALPPKTI